MDFLADRLHGYAKLDFLAMEPEKRPGWFREDKRFHYKTIDGYYHDSDILRQFQRPEGWRTWDSVIPRWYEQWYSGLTLKELKFPFEPEDQPRFPSSGE